MAMGWITWTHRFQGILLNDISNAPNLCKYSEHRSEEVMAGLKTDFKSNDSSSVSVVSTPHIHPERTI